MTDPRSGSERIFVNGVHGGTGRPLLHTVSLEDVARFARGVYNARNGGLGVAEIAESKRREKRQAQDHLEPRFGVDCADLSQAGWGVILPAGREAELRGPLTPLLDLRRAQASGHGSQNPCRYRELSYRAGDSKSRFLARHGVGPGPVDPDLLPYYLLIVGGPEEIPFRFQFQLDVQFAVGRLALAGEALARYAETVVAVERGELTRSRSAVFWGTSHAGDRATEQSARKLVAPLAHRLETQRRDWDVETICGEAASKRALAQRLAGGAQSEAPALLFTASHGVGFDLGDPRQRERQGALLCQDWCGGEIGAEHLFAASDVADHDSVAGLVAFLFACYGAGTPSHDSFEREGVPLPIAPESFVARLPERLLGHPNGGALAVVGHVDRAWSFSFEWANETAQLAVFESALDALLEGLPVGAAMEFFNQRFAEVSTDLSDLLEEERWGRTSDFLDLASLWVALHDARSYVILGDPGVRLAVPPIKPNSDHPPSEGGPRA